MATPLQIQRLRRARQLRASQREELARVARASFTETIGPNVYERAVLYLALADDLADGRTLNPTRRKP